MPEPLPHPDRVRVLLTDKRIASAELARHGDRYAEAGQPNVAVMFYERARSKDGLLRLKKLALDAGDEFVLSAIARADASLVQEADWRACADAAHRAGKLSFACDAYRKAGDEEKAAAAQAELARALAGAGPPSPVSGAPSAPA